MHKWDSGKSEMQQNLQSANSENRGCSIQLFSMLSLSTGFFYFFLKNALHEEAISFTLPL